MFDVQQEPLPVEIDFSLVWVIALFFALQLTATAMVWGVGALRNALQSRRRDAELRTTAKDLGLEHGRSMLGMLAVEGSCRDS